jgi:hypothetical protein
LPGGSGEAGGEDNRRWCELIHGATTSPREKRHSAHGAAPTTELQAQGQG